MVCYLIVWSMVVVRFCVSNRVGKWNSAERWWLHSTPLAQVLTGVLLLMCIHYITSDNKSQLTGWGNHRGQQVLRDLDGNWHQGGFQVFQHQGVRQGLDVTPAFLGHVPDAVDADKQRQVQITHHVVTLRVQTTG